MYNIGGLDSYIIKGHSPISSSLLYFMMRKFNVSIPATALSTYLELDYIFGNRIVEHFAI